MSLGAAAVFQHVETIAYGEGNDNGYFTAFFWQVRGGIEKNDCTERLVSASPDEVIGFFQVTWPFQPHYGPMVDSACNRNE
jgi:hypothetical protein